MYRSSSHSGQTGNHYTHRRLPESKSCKDHQCRKDRPLIRKSAEECLTKVFLKEEQWVVPHGVHYLEICSGAGGGGGGGGGTGGTNVDEFRGGFGGAGGGGSSGESQTILIQVQPKQILHVHPGAGGLAGALNVDGESGGDTIIKLNYDTILVVTGGVGGVKGSPGEDATDSAIGDGGNGGAGGDSSGFNSIPGAGGDAGLDGNVSTDEAGTAGEGGEPNGADGNVGPVPALGGAGGDATKTLPEKVHCPRKKCTCCSGKHVCREIYAHDPLQELPVVVDGGLGGNGGSPSQQEGTPGEAGYPGFVQIWY